MIELIIFLLFIGISTLLVLLMIMGISGVVDLLLKQAERRKDE